MLISIQTRKGKCFTLEVDQKELVEELKNIIFKYKNKAIDQQHLIFNCISLKNGHTLDEYNIINGSTVYLFNLRKSLLLSSSKIFNDSTFIDRIHQSCIDLMEIPEKKDAFSLLIEAISYLDEDLDVNTTKELFSVISSYVMHYPKNFLLEFNTRISKPPITAKHIILMSIILSDVSQFNPKISISDFNNLITNAFNDILPQIERNDVDNLKVLGFHIIPEYREQLISNIVLLTNLTEPIVKTFYPFFLSKSLPVSKLNFFIQKVSDSGLIEILPESLLLENNLFLKFSCKTISKVMSSISNDNFKKIIPLIESEIIKKGQITSEFSNSLVSKCIEADFKPSSIMTLLSQYTNFQSVPFWEYLIKNNIRFTDQMTSNLEAKLMKSEKSKEGSFPDDFPKTPLILKVISQPAVLPKEFLSYCLLNADSLDVYEAAFRSKNIVSSVLATEEFWKHVLSLVSSNKCTDNLIESFAFYFQKSIGRMSVNNIFDHLIFDDFPPNEAQSKFLFDLLEKLPQTYINVYHNFAHEKSMIAKLAEQKKIPPPSLCKLFNLNSVNFLSEITPLVLYEYALSSNKQLTNVIKKLDILPMVDEPSENLINFIKEGNNFDYITTIDEKSLSLIACSLYCVSFPMPVTGLTVENMLPFCAIALNQMNECKVNLNGLDPEMLNMLVESCTLAHTSCKPILIESLNVFISKIDSMFNFDIFPLNTVFDIIDSSCSFLLKNEYKADKSLLIITFFKLSFQNAAIRIFQKYGTYIIELIVQNLNDVIKSVKFQGYLLNLDMFDSSEVESTIVNIIQNSTSPDLIKQTIIFYCKYCINGPSLEFDDDSGANKAFQNAIENEEFDDALLILSFMKESNIKINRQKLRGKKIRFDIGQKIYANSKFIEIDDLVSHILSDPNPAENSELFRMLFKLFMKNSYTSARYITASLDRVSNNLQLTPDNIFSLSTICKENRNSLIFALNHSYAYFKPNKVFIRIINPEPFPFTEPKFKFFDRLFEEKSLQSFVCLQNIAAAFPFFFDNNSIKVIEIVLPTLNSIPLLFEKMKETNEIIVQLKTAFAALSFLYVCLYSTEFISFFVPWLFENFTKLTDSQVYCMMHILESLLETELIDRIVLAYAIKYDFINIILKLLTRNLNDGVFRDTYYKKLYQIILLYNNSFMLVDDKSDLMLIEGIKNDQLKNPFQNQFNNSITISETSLSKLDFIFPSQNLFCKKIEIFYNDISQPKKFWISSDHFNNYYIDLELSSLSKFICDDIHSVPKQITSKMYSYLLTKPHWVIDFIEDPSMRPRLQQHQNVLNEVITKLNKMRIDANNNGEFDSYRDDVYVKDYFSSQIDNEQIFNEVLKEILTFSDQRDDESLFELVIKITPQNHDMLFFFQFLSDYISKGADFFVSSPKLLSRICQIIRSLLKTNPQIQGKFFEMCGNKLIEIAISNSFVQNELIIANLCNLLLSLKCELPFSVTHLIGFILIYHPSLIEKGLQLYSKLGDSKSSNIIKMIQNRYNKEIKETDPNLCAIEIYINNIPSLAKDDISNTNRFLEKVVRRYNNNRSKNNNLTSIIISLINAMAPDPTTIVIPDNFDTTTTTTSTAYQTAPPDDDDNDYRSYKKKKSKNKNVAVLSPAPKYIKQSSPFFWKVVYELNRSLLNELISKDDSIIDKLSFVCDYNELLSFNIRFQRFKKYMNQIRSGNRVNIKVSHSTILIETLKTWTHNDPKDFLGNLQVQYTGENGSDAGGLTKDWITCVVKELFKPELGLFVSSDNQSYQPNHLARLNSINREVLKMAGGIIGLSLARNETINAHLSIPFLRQILHQKIRFDDVKEYDNSLYNSLKSVLDAKDAKSLDLFFAIDEVINNRIMTVNLVENGDKIQVTNENKNDYINAYINYKFKLSIEKQLEAFSEGFETFIEPKFIKMFSPKELDTIICGRQVIDIEDMKRNIRYSGAYQPNHPVIQMFFDVISKWNQENLSKLLHFFTGSSQLGVNGFADYKTKGNPITIASGGSKNRLPIAHTCSNTLDLPQYDNEKDMNDKLLLAIQECQFGIA